MLNMDRNYESQLSWEFYFIKTFVYQVLNTQSF